MHPELQKESLQKESHKTQLMHLGLTEENSSYVHTTILLFVNNTEKRVFKS